MKNKIRLYLFILTLLFIATAATIRYTVSPNDVLELETKNLTDNLHRKEKIIDKLFEDSLSLITFKNSQRYPLQVNEIGNKVEDENIHLYIFKKNEPIFWSTNVFVPQTEVGLRSDVAFINNDIYSYVVKRKKLNEEITILALLPIEKHYDRINFNGENDKFYDYLKTKNLKLAEFNDSQHIKNIYSINKTYLFSVKLKADKHNTIFLQIQLFCWILGTICFVSLISSLCVSIAKSGHPYFSILILIITFLIVRIIDIETNWLSENSSLEIFDPKFYAFNYFSPNLWSLLINSLAIFWISYYCYYIKKQLKFSKRVIDNNYGIFIHYLLLSFLYICFYLIFNQVNSLIANTAFVETSVIQNLYSNSQSIIYISIYSLNIIALLFLTDIIIYAGKRLCKKNTVNLNVQLFVIVQFLIIAALDQDFTLSNILIGALILIRSIDNAVLNEKNISTQVITLVCLSLLSTIKYAEAIKQNYQEIMKINISMLQSDNDTEAITLFSDLENNIVNDLHLKNLLKQSYPNVNIDDINRYLQRKYLTGYLSKYEFKNYISYNTNSSSEDLNTLDNIFREKVINSSTRVYETHSFYKGQTEIGTFEYFAKIHLPIQNDFSATLLLDLKTKSINKVSELSLMNLLNKSNYSNDQIFKNVSYALYRNGNLITQDGNYTYANSDTNYPSKIKEFISLEDNNGYYLMMYRPTNDTSIIVSYKKQSYWQYIAMASISFLILYLITNFIKFLLQVLPKYFKYDFNLHNLRYHFRLVASKIRYSTRIQSIVIASVLVAIVISGVITFFSIRIQSQKTSETQYINFISQLVSKLETKVVNDTSENLVVALRNSMRQISDVLVTDFNLYDRNGKLFFASDPKAYDNKIISQYINPSVYIDLNVLKKSEKHLSEYLDKFEYQSTYATIQDSEYNTIAYLGIPYYNAKEIESERTNILLNTILNVYTIILISFAFLAIYISNKITLPLQIIGKKLSQTNLSTATNEPLYWEKNDEIGVLVKEYNYMLVKLEENALQLRSAERESTWREMAKQVAHEIKNPLTPMKLGIQQLSKSFKEQDPRFEERFEKISSSFIEQIDALTHIASEFSAFAKLPETKLVEISLLEKILKTIEVYNNHQNTTITLNNHTGLEKIFVIGDKGQLLRTFNNLIKNGIEAAIGRRRIQIDITVERYNKKFIQVKVKDNGFGIPPEIIPNIFRPNFTTKSSGTGLGLAFVKQTIDGMGGKINFETMFNVGTTFYIEIPLFLGDKN